VVALAERQLRYLAVEPHRPTKIEIQQYTDRSAAAVMAATNKRPK
jgi:hypothetical protein